jgi:hypothetical protein
MDIEDFRAPWSMSTFLPRTRPYSQDDVDAYVRIFREIRRQVERQTEPIRRFRRDIEGRNVSPWAHDAIFNIGYVIHPAGFYDDYGVNITRGDFIEMIMNWVQRVAMVDDQRRSTIYWDIVAFRHFHRLETFRIANGHFDMGATISYTYVFKHEGKEINSAVIDWPDPDEVNRNFGFRAHDIAAAQVLGITDAQNLNQPLTREQAVTMIMRAVNLVNLLNDGIPLSALNSKTGSTSRIQAPIPAPKADFTDMNLVSSWAIDGVNFARANGIITGVGGGRFDPRSMLTIEQAIVMLDRIKS